jgi:hypothetical protein
LLNRFLKINYQEDRAAIYLIPIFYGMVFFGIDSLYPFLKRYTLLLIFPFLIIPAYSLSQISLDKTVYGNSQQVPVEFYDYISRESAGR